MNLNEVEEEGAVVEIQGLCFNFAHGIGVRLYLTNYIDLYQA